MKKLDSQNSYVFLDISIDSSPVGRIEFELFSKDLPKTCENFRSLCTGEKGFTQTQPNTRLHYKNSFFHRIIPGFICQGGDITGNGGESIYMKRFFEDEGFKYKNNYGYLAMANCGKNTNGSQFFINLCNEEGLNEKNVVFGKLIKGNTLIYIYINILISIGEQVLKMLEKHGSASGVPRKDVRITACGQFML